MGVVIVFMILPLILKGYNAILVTVGLSSALTGLFILLLSGRSKKNPGCCRGHGGRADYGRPFGLCGGKTGYLTGLSTEEAQTLHFMHEQINFQGVLFFRA